MTSSPSDMGRSIPSSPQDMGRYVTSNPESMERSTDSIPQEATTKRNRRRRAQEVQEVHPRDNDDDNNDATAYARRFDSCSLSVLSVCLSVSMQHVRAGLIPA